MYDLRRNDYDVTNTVQVSATRAVKAAVGELCAGAWPGESFDRVAIAFEEFDKLFNGRMPGFHGVDTIYHDLQHSLDMTLAMARLMVGYERSVLPAARFGADRARMALVTSLFHDAGYIREYDDRTHRNGAEYTLYHVTRSARFLSRILPSIGMEGWVPTATRVVHFTGYEVDLNQLHLPDPRDRRLGHLLGTADLIAQMADRCYLEKCRDRLYPEFVLGGIAAVPGTNGALQVRYSSGLDLLRQTPRFVRETRVQRLEGEFDHAYKYMEVLFDGKNPYLDAIDRNLEFLDRVLRTERWPLLRRNPPLFTSAEDAVGDAVGDAIGQVRGLMLNRLKVLWT